jgi:hypothetical protein
MNEKQEKRIDLLKMVLEENQYGKRFMDDEGIALMDKWILEMQSEASDRQGTGITRTAIAGYYPDGSPRLIDITSPWD